MQLGDTVFIHFASALAIVTCVKFHFYRKNYIFSVLLLHVSALLDLFGNQVDDLQGGSHVADDKLWTAQQVLAFDHVLAHYALEFLVLDFVICGIFLLLLLFV
jgi:hypothetical protein